MWFTHSLKRNGNINHRMFACLRCGKVRSRWNGKNYYFTIYWKWKQCLSQNTEQRSQRSQLLFNRKSISCFFFLFFAFFVYAINRDDNVMDMQLEANIVQCSAVSNTKTTVESKNIFFQANHCFHFISNKLIQFR